MGYVHEPKIYRLTFADPDLAELEVMARSVPTGNYLTIARLAEQTDAGEANVEKVEELLEGFAKALVSWNLEEHVDPANPQAGTRPVPATLEGLRGQDPDLVMAIIWGWLGAIEQVSAPLDQPSNGGAPPPVTIPMEPLSPSRAS